MDKTTDSLPSYEDACKLMQNINKHLLYMVKTALSYLEIEATEVDILQKNPVKKKEKANSENIVFNEPQVTRRTTDILDAENKIFKESLGLLLSDDFHFSGNSTEYQYFLLVGIRYYRTRLQDDKFSFLCDLSEMLAVDRQMNQIFSYCLSMALLIPPIIKKRKIQRDSGATIKEKNWKNITEEIKELANEIERNKNKIPVKYTRHGLATKILSRGKCSLTSDAIHKSLNDHLDEGEIEPRKQYPISELMKKLKIIS